LITIIGQVIGLCTLAALIEIVVLIFSLAGLGFDLARRINEALLQRPLAEVRQIFSTLQAGHIISMSCKRELELYELRAVY
jgi:hypothetical protein